ncbi:MAG: O-antigen ligase family protein [Verrucomicrobiota bacterium]
MPIATAIFFALGLYSAMIIGPGSRPWTWGAAIACVAVAQIPAVISLWHQRSNQGKGFALLGLVAVAWFGWRAAVSPVVEFAQADGILLAAAVGAFVCARVIYADARAIRVWNWLLAAAILANLAIGIPQWKDRQFTVLLPKMDGLAGITGFFTHYNETANFLVAAAALVGAGALFGPHSRFARCVLGVISLSGLAGIYFTHSRGGIFAGITAAGVFSVLALLAAKQQRSRWFAPTMMALPLVLAALGGLLFTAWSAAQKARGGTENIAAMMDNNVRLYLLGIAAETASLHPWAGGGSRSFSWECNPLVSVESFGAASHLPEFVHNELMQAATDYGVTGAALLLAFFGILPVHAILRLTHDDKNGVRYAAGYAGALAGLTGMFVQSCFSFVFHLVPGILLLGCTLGILSLAPASRRNRIRITDSSALLTIGATASIMVLCVFAVPGLRLSAILWPAYFNRGPAMAPADRLRALEEANAIWPSAALANEQGRVLQTQAGMPGAGHQPIASLEAVEKYTLATKLHPFDAAARVNRANLLSHIGDGIAAEAEFAAAIQLQGGMENAYRALAGAAQHHHAEGFHRTTESDWNAALAPLRTAAEYIERAAGESYFDLGLHQLRVNIHLTLGAALEHTGDWDAAMKEYDFAATLSHGAAGHFSAGRLLGRQAVKVWYARQPSQALRMFLEARQKVGRSPALPVGVTEAAAKEVRDYLDKQIAFLKEAKVTVDD